MATALKRLEPQMGKMKLTLVHGKKQPYVAAQSGARMFRTEYASGSGRPGYSKTLESATMNAMRHLLLDGYGSATIICLISEEDVVRMRINDDRTKVNVTSIRTWKIRTD